MKVTILVGAASAYACIKEDFRTLDVLLSPGMSPEKSLLESADEMRQNALKLIERADLIERAIVVLQAEKGR